MIGGNLEAVLQRQIESEINLIGETVVGWVDYHTFTGFLDLMSGDSKYNYNTKMQESTHIFVADYVAIDTVAEDKRMLIDGKTYDVTLIDDVMNLHQHFEIYLKYVG